MGIALSALGLYVAGTIARKLGAKNSLIRNHIAMNAKNTLATFATGLLLAVTSASVSLAQDIPTNPVEQSQPRTSVPADNSPVAKDCGFPPQEKPVIPSGAIANRTQMNAAIAGIRTFGTLVNNYLNCMEANREKMFVHMNKEQRDRWVDDFNGVADELEVLQNKINEEIRAFNRAQDNDPQTSIQNSN